MFTERMGNVLYRALVLLAANGCLIIIKYTQVYGNSWGSIATLCTIGQRRYYLLHVYM